MTRNTAFRRLALGTAMLLVVMALVPPNYVYAAQGQRLRMKLWYYDWAWQGYYVLYRMKCIEGRSYTIQVVPETTDDDPDLYMGTGSPEGTDNWRCSPENYLWASENDAGKIERIKFTAGYTGRHYFCVYAYAPNWTGWYVRIRKR